MTTTDKAPQIFQALVDMQDEISTTGIAKSLSATDKTGKELYKARSIDSVYNLLSPLFAKHGVVVGLNCLSKEREAVQTKYSIQYQTFVTVEYSFTSAKDGSKHQVTVIGEAFDHSDKGIAKAMAMAFKYACFQVFCIPVCDDPDATVHEKMTNEDYNDSRQNVSYSTTKIQGSGRQQQNNGQQQNRQTNYNQQQQRQPEYINREQANELMNAARLAGQDPAEILKHYGINRFGELLLKDFKLTLGNLQRFIQENQNIQKQTNQRRGNTSNNGQYQRSYS